MKEFILNELPVSKEIKSKIDYIKESSLRYDDFNDFKFLMNNLENFSINDKLSQNKTKQNINNFIAKLIKDLDSIAEKIVPENTQKLKEAKLENTNQIYFDYQKTADTLFYEALARVSEFNNKQEATKEEIGNLLESVSELLLNKEEEFNEEQLNLLSDIEETLKEEFISYGEKDDKDYELVEITESEFLKATQEEMAMANNSSQLEDDNQQKTTQKDLLSQDIDYKYDIQTITDKCNQLNISYYSYVKDWHNGEIDREKFKEIMSDLEDRENQQDIKFIKNFIEQENLSIEIPSSLLKDWDNGKIDRERLKTFKESLKDFKKLIKELEDYEKENILDIHRAMGEFNNSTNSMQYIKDNIHIVNISSYAIEIMNSFSSAYFKQDLEDLHNRKQMFEDMFRDEYEKGNPSPLIYMKKESFILVNLFNEFDKATREKIAISKEYEKIIQDIMDVVKKDDATIAEIFAKIMYARHSKDKIKDKLDFNQNFKLEKFFDELAKQIQPTNELGYIDKSKIDFKYLNSIVLEDLKNYKQGNTLFDISKNTVKAFEFDDEKSTKRKRKL